MLDITRALQLKSMVGYPERDVTSTEGRTEILVSNIGLRMRETNAPVKVYDSSNKNIR